MQVKLAKYSKNEFGLPVLIEEYDVTRAVILDDDLIIDERIEINEFFELGASSMDLTLKYNLVSDEVIALFAKEVLDEYIIGFSYTDDDCNFRGYLHDESIDHEKYTNDYLITAVNWWKYFYDEMASRYCPDIGQVAGSWSIKQWLKFTFECDIIKDFKLDLTDDFYLQQPFINIYKYQKYGPFTTIRTMLDNIHKKLKGVFEVTNDGTLLFTSYSVPVTNVQSIDKLIVNSSYRYQIIKHSKYDTILTEEYGAFIIQRMENGKLVSSWAGNEGELYNNNWEILDLRQKAFTMSGDGSYYDYEFIEDNKIKISIEKFNNISYGDFPDSSWVNKAFRCGVISTWGAVITDVNDDLITIDWLGLISGVTGKPKKGDIGLGKLYDISEMRMPDLTFYKDNNLVFSQWPKVLASIVSNEYIISRNKVDSYWVSKGGVIVEFANSIPLYLFHKDLVRVYSPVSIVFCTVKTVLISVKSFVEIGEEIFKVVNSIKNCYTKLSELELEKIDNQNAQAAE